MSAQHKTCPDCGKELLYGRHPGIRCEATTATQSELNELYAAMERINLKPIDIVRQKRIEGERIRFLSELSSVKVRALIEDCRNWEKRHGRRPS